MIAIEEYRCRIGSFLGIRKRFKKPTSGVSVPRDQNPSRSNVLTVGLLSILLLIGGVEPNPGPKTAYSVKHVKTSNDYLWHSDWTVVQPAQAGANIPANIPCHHAVGNYIDKEFSLITNQHKTGVISVPPTFPISHQLSEGERAEMTVFGKITV